MTMRNVKIMGESSISGGYYRKVSIMGEARIIGEVIADEISIMGNLKAEDDVKSEKLSVMGNSEFVSFEGKEMKIMGNAKFKGLVKIDKIKITGEMDAQKDVKSEEILLYGHMEVDSKVETETFVSKGAFDFGSLNANDIDVKLGGTSSVSEIGGESVRVRYSRVKRALMDLLDTILFRHTKRAELRCDTIEADRIELQNTVAKAVKGNNIIIGHGCRIGLVEYSENVYVDSNASVEKTVKI